MTKTYHIWHKGTGADHGIYKADTELEALAAMHTDAGYHCYVMAGEDTITYRDGCPLDGCVSLVGEPEDWEVLEVPPGDLADAAVVELQEQDDRIAEQQIEAMADDNEREHDEGLRSLSE